MSAELPGCRPFGTAWDSCRLYHFVDVTDPSQRLVPSTAPEDHPIHGAAEAGDLARDAGVVVERRLLIEEGADTCGRRQLMHRLLDAGFKVHPEAGGCHSYVLERPDMLRELLTRGGLDPNQPARAKRVRRVQLGTS